MTSYHLRELHKAQLLLVQSRKLAKQATHLKKSEINFCRNKTKNSYDSFRNSFLFFTFWLNNKLQVFEVEKEKSTWPSVYSLHTCYYFTCTSTLFGFWIHCEYDMAANMCHMDNIGKSASPSIRLLKDHRQEVKSSYLKSWRALLSVNKTSCSHFFIFVLLFVDGLTKKVAEKAMIKYQGHLFCVKRKI